MFITTRKSTPVRLRAASARGWSTAVGSGERRAAGSGRGSWRRTRRREGPVAGGPRAVALHLEDERRHRGQHEQQYDDDLEDEDLPGDASPGESGPSALPRRLFRGLPLVLVPTPASAPQESAHRSSGGKGLTMTHPPNRAHLFTSLSSAAGSCGTHLGWVKNHWVATEPASRHSTHGSAIRAAVSLLGRPATGTTESCRCFNAPQFQTEWLHSFVVDHSRRAEYRFSNISAGGERLDRPVNLSGSQRIGRLGRKREEKLPEAPVPAENTPSRR